MIPARVLPLALRYALPLLLALGGLAFVLIPVTGADTASEPAAVETPAAATAAPAVPAPVIDPPTRRPGTRAASTVPAATEPRRPTAKTVAPTTPAAPKPTAEDKPAAPALPTRAAAPTPASGDGSIVGAGGKLLIGSLVLVGALYGVMRLIKKMPIAKLLPGTDGPIRITARTHLGPKGSLCLVEVGRTTLLVAMTGTAIQTLHVWPEGEPVGTPAGLKTPEARDLPGQLRALEQRLGKTRS